MNKRRCAKDSNVITPQDIEELIMSAMPGSKVKASDMTGTSDHFEIEVVSKEFAGLSLMDQHKKIFAILEEEMKDRIHAVKLKTRIA